MNRIFKYTFCMCMAIIAPMQLFAQSGGTVTAGFSASREKVYSNEEFNLVLSITSTGVALDQNFQLSSMPEKSKLVFGDFHELAPERIMQDNQLREKRSFQTTARAFSPGIIELAPVLRVSVASGWGFMRQLTQYDIKTTPLSITVLPVPENGKPSDFSGAIGQFNLTAEIAPLDVAVGDLITATLRIKGSGYLDEVAPIGISPGRHFKAYPPKRISTSGQSEKVFEQTLVPQSANAATIPAISFCYFDPRTGTYKRTSQGPFNVTFHPTSKGPSGTIYTAKPKSGEPIKVTKVSTNTKPYNPFPVLVSLYIGYWMVVLAIAIWVAQNTTRRSLVMIVIILIIAIMIFIPLQKLAGKAMASQRHATVIRSEKARLAPAYTAVVSFDIPADSIVTIAQTYGSWEKISAGDKKGWIPADALTNSPTTHYAP